MKRVGSTADQGTRKYTVSVASRTNLIILGVGIAVLVFLAVFPVLGQTQWTRRLIDFFCLLAAAELWNLMLGYAGLISVGQQGFIGIGAYTLWLFSDKLGINPLLSVVLAAIGGVIIALPTAALVFKLKGGYLAIGTWVIAEILRLIVKTIKQTGGGSGINIAANSNMLSGVGPDAYYSRVYWWALAGAVIAVVVTYLLLRSRTGLALKAMRDNDLAAESSGVNLWRTKLYTYLIAGAGCAMVGAIQAMYSLRVHPDSMFSVNWTAYLIFITVIGGIGTIEGPIIGAAVFYVLRETTSQYGTWYFIVLGILAIAVTVWSPAGIYGWVVKKTGFMLFPLQRRLQLADEGGSPGGYPDSLPTDDATGGDPWDAEKNGGRQATIDAATGPTGGGAPAV